MAIHNEFFGVTLPATGDLSATGQFRFASVDANGRGRVSAAGQTVIGIGQNKPGAQGRGWTVATNGVSKLLIGGTVNEGDRLIADANGRGVASTTANAEVGAIALGAGAEGDYIDVLLTPGVRY